MTTLIRSSSPLPQSCFFATPALAGPPLICHPFEVEGGKLIAWGTGPAGTRPIVRTTSRRLVADTTAVLTPDAPILTRMENMRRATIYAMRDPVIAQRAAQGRDGTRARPRRPTAAPGSTPAT